MRTTPGCFWTSPSARDAQELLAARFYRRPVRSDVEPGLELTGLSDFPLIDYDADWASDSVRPF